MPNVELHIAGPKSDPIKNPCEGYFYHGDVTSDKVSALLNRCDIFCMPSYFEAYGLVFIEALTYGLPCIGRNCYEMPYFIEDGKTGRLLKHDDPQELCREMAELLTNPEFTTNVRNLKEWYLTEYSWDTVAKRIYSVIIKTNDTLA